MESKPLVFRIHAVQRMFQRGISLEDVCQVLSTGKAIEDYPDDTPCPSRLVLGWCGSRPVHVVVADSRETQKTIIITVYEPDRSQWEAGFKRRKK